MLPVSTYGGMPATLRWIFWVYFFTHIPITILIDAQVRRFRTVFLRRRVSVNPSNPTTRCVRTQTGRLPRRTPAGAEGAARGAWTYQLNQLLGAEFHIYGSQADSVSTYVNPPFLQHTHPRITRHTQWYTAEFGDFLMAKPPRWFQSIVTIELFLQLPFFFVAVYGFWQGGSVSQSASQSVSGAFLHHFCVQTPNPTGPTHRQPNPPSNRLTAKNWLRLPCIIYGAHVATTLVPILDAFGESYHQIDEIG